MRNFWIILLLVSSARADNGIPLSQAVKMATKNHPLLRADRERINGARFRAVSLQSQFQPLLSLNAFGVTGRDSAIFPSSIDPINYGHFDSGDAANLNLVLSWRLPLFGRPGLTQELGSSERRLAEIALRNRARLITYEVRLAFADSQLKAESAQSAQLSLDSAEAILKVAQDKVEAGTLAKVFLLRAKSELEASKRDLAIALADKAKARLSLAASIGLSAGELDGRGFEVGQWDSELHVPASLTEAIELSANHPAILSNSLKISGLRAQLMLNRAAQKPDAYLMAMGDWLGTAQTKGDQSAKLGLVISFPLSDGGLRSAEVSDALSKVRAAEFEAKDVQNQIETEIGQAWADWQSVSAITRASDAGLEAANESYMISLLRFQEGKTTLSEVIEARAFLAKARLMQAESSAFSRKAWANLWRAIASDDELLSSPKSA